MIQANELRIGNWVYSSVSTPYNPAGIITVSSIRYDGINYGEDMGAHGIMPFEELVAIPIMAEILEKTGLRNIGEVFYFNEHSTPSLYNRGDFWIYSAQYEEIAYPRYVHQLQNIYFALNEKEL